jgi:UDP-3-O-[3-hydroxymyristoyl] glucosamine N-acyltransferase
MDHPGFFRREGPFALEDVASYVKGRIAHAADGKVMISDVKALDDAGEGHISFFDNRKYLAQLGASKGSACLIAEAFLDRVPPSMACIVVPQPYHAFAMALRLFYPDALTSRTAEMSMGEGPIHATARIGEGVRIEPNAVVGPEAIVGEGTIIAAGALVGYRCVVGKDCYIGPSVSLTHTLIGDRAIIHAGVRIGQDGFGFAMGKEGHLKVPQIGRVIIGDDVEIGANTTIDRGALKDTRIGMGTKIDNLVQIGHNVVVGRHCILVGQCGIAGSTVLGDFAVLGGQAGLAGHLTVGSGAQLAGNSAAMHSIPAGERWAGTPAKKMEQFARELAVVKRLAEPKK